MNIDISLGVPLRTKGRYFLGGGPNPEWTKIVSQLILNPFRTLCYLPYQVCPKGMK